MMTIVNQKLTTEANRLTMILFTVLQIFITNNI